MSTGGHPDAGRRCALDTHVSGGKVNYLALDTSSNACSVAVQVGDHVAVRHVVEARAHTRILMPVIKELLREQNLAPCDLDAVVLGNGPGSFIGMRIGASVAQGLAHGAGAEILTVSSLAVVAAEVFAVSAVDEVMVLQDARMGEVYCGSFQRGYENEPVSSGPEHIIPAGDVLLRPLPQGIAGSAWQAIPALRDRPFEKASMPVIAEVPNAKYLLMLGANRYVGVNAVSPVDLVPAYLRQKVAEPPRVTLPGGGHAPK